jgi:N-sulfoglucosamine sulfohydrolase
MKRRNFLKSMTTGALAVSTIPSKNNAAGKLPGSRLKTSPPNILLVLSDDHSVPHLGCYGDKVIKTPNLDQFAAEGIRFDRAYTTAPQCSPSRGSIFTGLPPQRIHMTRLATPLPPEYKTFPEYLKETGYFTGVCGRWYHLDGRVRPNPLLTKIYEKYNLQQFQSRIDYCKQLRFNDADRPAIEKLLGQVTQFLDKKPRDKPFFLYTGFSDPHHGWDKDAIPNPHNPDDIQVPAYLPDLPSVREALSRYYNEISRMDSMFGSLMKLLKKRGLEENTLVIFMGDNGFAFPHGKGSLYQPGIHVPMIARWPGVISPNRAINSLISGMDLAATFLDVSGIPLPEKMEGHSFKKLLTGEKYEGRKYIFATSGWHTREGNSVLDGFDICRSVTSETHSFIYNCLPHIPYRSVDFMNEPFWVDMKTENQRGTLKPEYAKAYFSPNRPIFELFDLKNDPNEFNNIYGFPEQGEIENHLKIVLSEWMHKNYDFVPPPIPS